MEVIIPLCCGVPHVQHLSLLLSHLSDRATNPLNRDTDWSSIHAFCDQLNSDLEGWEEQSSGPSKHTSCVALLIFFWSFMMCTALNTYCGFFNQFQASAGHQTAGPQDSVTTGVGSHASSTGEFESEPAGVASPASSAASNFRLVLGLASWIRVWVLDRSTDSVVLLEWNGRTGEARNCRDVSLSCSRVTHHGSAPV